MQSQLLRALMSESPAMIDDSFYRTLKLLSIIDYVATII